MPAPTLLTFCANRRAVTPACTHAPTCIETFDLRTGELVTRTLRERHYHATITEKFDSHQPSQAHHVNNSAIDDNDSDNDSDDGSSAECRSQVWHILTQCQSLHLHRSLTPPPPFTSALVRQASHTHASQLASTPSNSSLNRLDILCSTHPAQTVIRESCREELLPSMMRGGWSVNGNTVSRLSHPVTISELSDVVPEIATVLWSMISEYSDTVYKHCEAHQCHSETAVCEWANKHSITPSPLMVEWMRYVCQTPSLSLITQLIEHSGFAIFDTNGAGWDHRPLLKSTGTSNHHDYAQTASILHPVTDATLLLTKSSIEAYEAYNKPNVLNGYVYSRPPFVFPPVSGYLCPLDIEVESEALSLLKSEQSSEIMNVTSVEPSYGTTPTPTLSAASTTGTQSPLTASPSLTASVESSSMLDGDDLVDLAATPHRFNISSPRRSSLPANHKTANTSADGKSDSQSSFPSRFLFQSTWSVGDRYYRHGTKSLVSEFLGIDVPLSACPWPSVSGVEFVMAFTLNNQPPQPCVILHK